MTTQQKQTKTNNMQQQTLAQEATNENMPLVLTIKELLTQVHEKVKEVKELQQALAETKKYHSDELDQLFGALAEAQMEMPNANLNATNPYFKTAYSDLGEIVKKARLCLPKHGLSLNHYDMTEPSGRIVMITVLGHKSGQYMKSESPIVPEKPGIQAFGSCKTYLRRYNAAALIGMASDDEDDDGEKADKGEENVRTQRIDAKVPTISKSPNNTHSYQFISKDQLDELEYELEGYDDIHDEVLEKLQINSLANMPKSKFLASIKRIREIKQMKEGK